MAKKIILFALLLGVSTQVYSQDKSEVNVAQLREEATSNALDAIDAYDNFFSSSEKTYLIEATKHASKANALFDIYIDIKKVPEESDLISINNNIAQLANEFPKDLVDIPAGSFKVSGNNLQTNSQSTGQIVMATITTTKIIKKWLEGWEKRDYAN